MREKSDEKIYYYQSYTDDFVESSKQDYILPRNYQWVRKDVKARLLHRILYPLVRVFAFFYCRFILHATIVNKDILKQFRYKGCFLFGNHTQVMGDAVVPVFINGARPISVVVSSANMGIPVLGRILPCLGALPVPQDRRKLHCLMKGIGTAIDDGHCVVIYPEAHVWPYYTDIRPFPKTSFHFPVEQNAPCFSMTTTYFKRAGHKKPGIRIYLDGPFTVPPDLPSRMQQELLRDQVYAKMKERSKNSTFEYIRYKKG